MRGTGEAVGVAADLSIAYVSSFNIMHGISIANPYEVTYGYIKRICETHCTAFQPHKKETYILSLRNRSTSKGIRSPITEPLLLLHISLRALLL